MGGLIQMWLDAEHGSRQNLNFLTLFFNSCSIGFSSQQGGENSRFLFFLPYSLKEMKEKAILMFLW